MQTSSRSGRSPRTRVAAAALSAALSAALATALAAGLPYPTPAHAAPGAHGPNGEHLDAPGTAASASGLARLPDGSVNVPKTAQRRMAIRTVLAPLSEAAATVELPGRILPDPNGSGRVQAVHGGRIEPGPRGLPVPGQPVRRGEVLAWVRHHAEPYTLGAQQAQLADLRAQRRLAEQRVQRLEGLEGTVPRKEIEAARADAQSLAERERSIGASLETREALTAPVGGVITRTELVSGQVVEPRDVLVEIVDPKRMLVEATAADAAVAADVAGATLADVPDVTLRLRGVSSALRDGMVPMTFAVSPATVGTPLLLSVGQPVTVVARSRQRIEGIVLPAQAVVRNPSNEPIVWIKSGAERFVPQPVQFRPLDAGTVVITRGLGADNRVVVQGAALIAQIR